MLGIKADWEVWYLGQRPFDLHMRCQSIHWSGQSQLQAIPITSSLSHSISFPHSFSEAGHIHNGRAGKTRHDSKSHWLQTPLGCLCKGTINLKMKILSALTHPHVVSTLYYFLSSMENKRQCLMFEVPFSRDSFRLGMTWNVLRNNVIYLPLWLSSQLSLAVKFFKFKIIYIYHKNQRYSRGEDFQQLTNSICKQVNKISSIRYGLHIICHFLF